jgi:thiamine biosynthesis lipoprotein
MLAIASFQSNASEKITSSSQEEDARYYGFESPIMGTLFSLSLLSRSETQAQAIFTEATQLLSSLNALWSPTVRDSDVFKINQATKNAGQVISPLTFELLQQAKDVSVLTQGAFDITYASVGHLYDYRDGIRPNEALRLNALNHVGYEALLLNTVSNEVAKNTSAVKIDLGGIGKGAAVDQVKKLLLVNSISSAYISLGGDSYVLGAKQAPSKRYFPWMLGIKDPRSEERVVARIPLENIAVSTSGDYERFFIDQGERVHHILSPETGLPTSGLMSVTVIGPEPWKADALSTSVFVLGAKKGLALIESLQNYDVILIHESGLIRASSGLMNRSE